MIQCKDEIIGIYLRVKFLCLILKYWWYFIVKCLILLCFKYYVSFFIGLFLINCYWKFYIYRYVMVYFIKVNFWVCV